MNDEVGVTFFICTSFSVPDDVSGPFGRLWRGSWIVFVSATRFPCLRLHFGFHSYLQQTVVCRRGTLAPGNPDAREVRRRGTLMPDAGAGHDPMGADEVRTGPVVSDELARAGLRRARDLPTVAVVAPDALMSSVSIPLGAYAGLMIRDEVGEWVVHEGMTVVVPARGSEWKEIAEACFPVLWQALSADNIVRIVRSLLLERHLFFISEDVRILTLSVLACIALKSPMPICCSMQPLVPPAHMATALESPVPVILGFVTSASWTDEATVVWLDRNAVDYPDNISHMPGAAELRAAFRRCPAEQRLEACQNHVRRVVDVDRVRAARVRDTTDPSHPRVAFVEGAYLLGRDAREVAFYEELVQTQAFLSFFDEIAAESAG